jgi:hypothetical protein
VEPASIDDLALTGQRRPLAVWIPKRVVREIEALSEKIERGVGSVFATAYRIGRRSLPR